MSFFFQKKILLSCFIILLMVAGQAMAGPIDKAFEALEMKDYFKAKQLFEKRLNKERLAATYGMCRVFLEQQNPFFNLDSARVYALRSESLFKAASQKERDKVLDYAITQERVDMLRKTVYALALEEVTKANTIAACERFLERFPASPDKKTVIDLKSSLAFGLAKENGSPEALRKFMAENPSSKEHVEAKVMLDRAIFNAETAAGTVNSFKAFIARYPDSPHKRTAEDRVYELSTNKGTLDQYRSFISNNPTNPHVNEAWRNLLSVYTEDYREESLADFKLSYPDYPFMAELDAEMDILRRRLFAAKKDGKWGFIDRHGREAMAFQYQQIQPFSEGLAAFQREDRWGYMDKRGKEVIAPQFDEADAFRNGMAIVAKGESFGAINTKGETVVRIEHDELLDFEAGMAAFAKGGLFGYVASTGEIVIPVKFDDAWTFSEGLAAVESEGLMGFINTKGDLVIPNRFDEVESFKNGKSRVVEDGLMGLINKKGELIVPCKYDRIGQFSEGLAPVLLEDKAGFINHTGKELIPLKLSASLEDLARMQIVDGRSIAKKKKFYGMVDSTGAEVHPFRFDLIDPIRDGRYAAKLKGKFGFINARGIEVIPFIFEDTKGFSGGRAAVKEKGLWGYINDAGEMVIAAQFALCGDFSSGVAVVEREGFVGLIDERGELLLPIVMDRIDRTDDNGLLRLEKKGRMAYYDINARKILWSEGDF